jgi:hypothetical protein
VGIVEVDALAVLPVTAASASAAFARASDPSRDDTERRRHLAFLEVTLSAVRELLDGCDRETARLAGELDGRAVGARCRGASAICRRCVTAPLTASSGVVRCSRCGSTIAVSVHIGPCPEPSTVLVRDLTGAEQALCLAHAAGAARQVHHLSVIAASRYSRAVLSEVTSASCVISRRARRLVDAAPVATP